MNNLYIFLKKYWRTYWSLMTILSLSLPLYSQDGYSLRSISDLANEVQSRKKLGASTIEGSPYLHDEFQEGEVFFDGKFKVEHLPMRLNLHSGEMEYKSMNAVMVFADPAKVDKVIIGQEMFIYLNKGKSSPVNGFVRIWNEGYPTIISKMNVNFLKMEPAKPYVDPKPDRYERAPDEQFIMLENGDIEKISSVKKLIQALGSHESELSAYAKKEKISASDASELASLINYFKQLNN